MSDKKEYIERGAFLAKLKEHHDYVMQDPAFSKLVKWREAICYGRHKNLAEQAPAADVVEVKHGRWVKKVESRHDTHTDEWWDEEYCSCPICGKDSDWEHNYCPNCGCKMDGGNDMEIRMGTKEYEPYDKLTLEQRMYDHYVTSGGGDVCFAYGMSGHCGPECPEFGLRDGCREEDGGADNG